MNTGDRIAGTKRMISSADEYRIKISFWVKHARLVFHGVEEKGL